MLFWESDSDASDGGGWDEASDLVVSDSEYEDTRANIKRVKPNRETDSEPLDKTTGTTILDNIIKLLPKGVLQPLAGEHPVFGVALEDVLPEYITFSELRSKVDLDLLSSTAEFESEITKALFNACVADKTVSTVFPDLYKLFCSIPKYTPTVLLSRFSSNEAASNIKNLHTTAYKRILDKFSLLDNENLFTENRSIESDLPGPKSISDMRKSIDDGCYKTDLDFEIDLRWLYCRELIKSGDDWETARRLLTLVTRCCEEGGIHTFYNKLIPFQQRIEFPDHSVAEQLVLGIQSSSLLSNCGMGFDHPVENVDSYRSIVKHPIDFSTIKIKFELNMYSSIKSIVDDINLMFSNKKLYSSMTTPEDEIPEVVVFLEDEVRGLMKGLGITK